MKIAWSEAEKDYITSETISFSDISKKYGVAPTTVADYARKQKWTTKRADIRVRAEKKTIEKAIDLVSAVNAKHIQIAKRLQGVALKALQEREAGGGGVVPKYMKDVNEALKISVAIERAAHNIEDNKPDINVQINFNAQPGDASVTKEEINTWA